MNVAFRMAERVERTGGPKAGLVAYRALAGHAGQGPVRARALLAALRCAVATADAPVLAELTPMWERQEGAWDRELDALCKEMVGRDMPDRAIALAHAEVCRRRSARALYRHARCLDVHRRGTTAPAVAADAFADAVDRAVSEGAHDLEHAARLARASILAASWDTRAEALEEAGRVDPARLPEARRVTLARILLLSPSRFVRASAIDLLGQTPTAEAGAVLARAADERVLTPLEDDRLRAVLGRHWPPAAAALAGSAAAEPELAALQTRAREIAQGRYEPPRDEAPVVPGAPAARRAHRLARVLDALAAMRDAAPARAAQCLRELTQADETEALPAEVVALAEAALASNDRDLRAAAVRFFEGRLGRGQGPSPPRGYAALSRLLHAEPALAALALRAAAAEREPGARELLAEGLVREGWALAAREERARAIAALREAKHLFGQSTQGA